MQVNQVDQRISSMVLRIKSHLNTRSISVTSFRWKLISFHTIITNINCCRCWYFGKDHDQDKAFPSMSRSHSHYVITSNINYFHSCAHEIVIPCRYIVNWNRNVVRDKQSSSEFSRYLHENNPVIWNNDNKYSLNQIDSSKE